jgi:hypothetical protein
MELLTISSNRLHEELHLKWEFLKTLRVYRFTYQYGSLIGSFLMELLPFLKILLHNKWIYKVSLSKDEEC